jgi:protein-S-isoprenylcysteine O-methyltransferase Ste14
MKAKSRAQPPRYFVVLLLLSLVLHFIFPVWKIIYPPYTYSGFVLIALGAALNIWSDWLFKKRKTTVKPHETPASLEVSGPFRIIRHPMYLGMMAVLLGVAILHGTLITFVFPVAFVILMERMFIPLEEKNLERAFGNRYLEYKKRVRRWI